MTVRKLAPCLLLAIATTLAAAGASDDPVLRIHLPRTVQVRSAELTLGQIVVMNAADHELVDRASAVRMGRSPADGGEIQFDRATILSRLAASGIPARQIRIGGAAGVVVTAEYVPTTPEAMDRAARALLGEADWALVRDPGPVGLPAGLEPQIHARLISDPDAESPIVEVTIRSGEQDVATRTLQYRRVHTVQQLVATRDIAPGEILAPHNVEVRTTRSHQPQGETVPTPYGLAAIRAIRRETVIHAGLLVRPSADPLVRRNQNVLMRIHGEGFIVQTTGQAIDEGRVGEFIKVRNVDTRRILTARVLPDGSVEPIMQRLP